MILVILGWIYFQNENSQNYKVIEVGSTIHRRGRSRRKWTDEIREAGNKNRKNLDEMKKLARDRKEWRHWLQEELESSYHT